MRKIDTLPELAISLPGWNTPQRFTLFRGFADFLRADLRSPDPLAVYETSLGYALFPLGKDSMPKKAVLRIPDYHYVELINGHLEYLKKRRPEKPVSLFIDLSLEDRSKSFQQNLFEMLSELTGDGILRSIAMIEPKETGLVKELEQFNLSSSCDVLTMPHDYHLNPNVGSVVAAQLVRSGFRLPTN